MSLIELDYPQPEDKFGARLNDYERRIAQLELLLSQSRPIGRRNKLRNGVGKVNQRVAPGIPSGNYGTVSSTPAADGWRHEIASDGTWEAFTHQIQNFGGSPNVNVRPSHAFWFNCTIVGTLSASDYSLWGQTMEGWDLQDLLWGTAQAKPVTVSGWINAQHTNTLVFELAKPDGSRHYSIKVPVLPLAWNRVEVTFPGDTNAAGVIVNNNQPGLNFNIWNGAGTTFNNGGTPPAAWSTVAAERAAGATHFAATAPSYIGFTMMQLEVGSVATPYEEPSYDDEYNLCSRYYQRQAVIFSGSGFHTYGSGFTTVNGGGVAGASKAKIWVPLRAGMRAAPAIFGTHATLVTNRLHWSATVATPTAYAILASEGHNWLGAVEVSFSVALGAGQPVVLQSDGNANSYVEFALTGSGDF